MRGNAASPANPGVIASRSDAIYPLPIKRDVGSRARVSPGRLPRRLRLLAMTGALAGCTAANLAGIMPGQEVTVGEDVFTVEVNGTTAVARNFATGIRNQERLYTNAQEAIRTISGCELTTFVQEPGVNTYRARLDCA